VIAVTKLHGEDAWRYLMESVTDGQGDLREADAITRYYLDAGTPPGRWLGTGLGGLDRGRGLAPGSQVSGGQMERLFGQGRDPVTGEKLGRGFRKIPSYSDRVAARVRALPPGLTNREREDAVERIRETERTRKVGRAVAGFDYTFNPPKSVSALWAVADQGTREQITAAHHDAITDILALIERDVARTRIGAHGVAQVPVQGVIAAAFDHYDTREHDPQLHTHVVIANRVQAPDGRWHTLDSRGMIFPSVVALSETYDTLLADHLTRRLGTGWEVRDTGRKLKNAKWEITGVPDELVDHFSTRRSQIETAADELIAAYRQHTGREPDDATKLKLRRRATIDTRKDKTLYPLATLAAEWRRRAATVLGVPDPGVLVDHVTRPAARERGLRVDDLAGPHTDALVDEILARLHESRATWTRWNIHAETARATMKYRMATPADRDTLHQVLIEEVQRRSVLLSAPPLAYTSAVYRRPDGTSQFTPEHSAVYTSRIILDAEARLLDAGRTLAGPRVDADLAERILGTAEEDGRYLSDDQAAAVFAVATSGRVLDVLVGAAGSGKTTALAALRHAWEAEHGSGTVIGLAPTAKAADVLAGSLDIPTDNTAKWLTEHNLNTGRRTRVRDLLDRAATARAAGNPPVAASATATAARLRKQIRRWELQPGQLLIIDEASMCGTLALDQLVAHAHQVAAKVLLVGDWAQLSAVESGGAFRMLAHDRTDPPELSTVRRFTNQWERAASIGLRLGDTRAVDTYTRHGRVRGGHAADMTNAAYTAWAADEHAGRTSLLIADTNTAVADLNTRARADRVAWGLVEPDGHRLHDGARVGVGDRIVTRKIDRTLRTGPNSWVKNGDQWIVAARFDDGSLAVHRAIDTDRRKVLTLPAGYVRQHVELGYATTAHRAQGDTVDTAHALIRAHTTRESLYVAMTRGRHANTAYVCTHDDHDDEHGPVQEFTVTDVLDQVLARTGADLSAHDTLRAEQQRVGTIAQLAAEYDTIAREARHQRWTALAAALPGTSLDQATTSPARPSLTAALRHAEAAGLDLDTALPQLAPGPFPEADPVEALRDRVQRLYDTATPGTRSTQVLIAGLIPAADAVTDPDVRRALAERAALIEQRAEALATRALDDHEPWIAHLGPPPHQPEQRLPWERAAATVAAYRDRYEITDPRQPLGDSQNDRDWTRRADRRRAQKAAAEARRLAAGNTADERGQKREPRRTGVEPSLSRDV
jgi:conjugative relaxase-like TrwC/TraI family protein